MANLAILDEAVVNLDQMTFAYLDAVDVVVKFHGGHVLRVNRRDAGIERISDLMWWLEKKRV